MRCAAVRQFRYLESQPHISLPKIQERIRFLSVREAGAGTPFPFWKMRWLSVSLSIYWPAPRTAEQPTRNAHLTIAACSPTLLI